MLSQAQQKVAGMQAAYHQALEHREYAEAYAILKEQLALTPSNLQNDVQDQLAQLCNFIAINAVKRQEFKLAEQFLRRAVRYSRHSPYLMLVSYNNWSCFHKKTQNNSMALLSIGKALALANHIAKRDDCLPIEKIKILADSHINLCVVLSQMNEHMQALENALLALRWIDKYNQKADEHRSLKSINDRNNVMLIAKYNAAVQLEYLKRTEEARIVYEEIRQFLLEWNVCHPLLRKIEKALNIVQNSRGMSRTSSTRKRRFSTPKIEAASTLSHYTKELECSTLNVHYKQPRVLQERSFNTITLAENKHSRSQSSNKHRPPSAIKILGSRRTMSRMQPLKSPLDWLE